MIYYGPSNFHTMTRTSTYAVVKEKFNQYFVKKHNVIYEHAWFNRLKQEEGETNERKLACHSQRSASGSVVCR